MFSLETSRGVNQLSYKTKIKYLLKKEVDIGYFKKFDLGGLLREQGSGIGLGWRDDFLIPPV